MVIPHAHTLIPNLGTLDRLLSAQVNDPQRMHAISRETEQLPHYLRGAAHALGQLESARISAVRVLDTYGGGPSNAVVVLPPDELDQLSYALDAYLYYVRRTFDALIAYLSRCPTRLDLPASMNDLVTKMKKGTDYRMDEQLANAILEYWIDVGARLKGYRDQTQHRAIILSTCVTFRTPDGVALQMLLPDSHEETKPSAIDYNPGVPGMQFALASFEKTVRFVNVLVERMIDLMAPGDEHARNTGMMTMVIRGQGMKLGAINGERVPAPVSITDVIERATRRQ